MYELLAPCSGCQRHVRVSESACPFCGLARRAAAATGVSEEPSGLSRAAVLVLGASLALAGCRRGDDGGPTMAPNNNNNASQHSTEPSSADIYGGPPPPAQRRQPDPNITAPAYGAPPGTGPSAPTPMATDGGAAPPSVEVQAYGAPAPPPPTPPGASGADAGAPAHPRRRH